MHADALFRSRLAALIGAGLLGSTAFTPAWAQSMDGSPSIQLAPLKVQGQKTQSPTGPGKGYIATSSTAGTKTNTPIIATPQTINVITAGEMKAQGAQTVSAALRYTPGVQDELYGAGTRADWVQLRGFESYDSIFLDGLRTDQNNWVYQLEPYGLSRLEVLKGPASVLYGENAPGGMINAVSKRPTDTPQHEIQLVGGSFGDGQVNFDSSGPVAGTDGKLDYRMVGVIRKSGTQVDHTSDNRQYFAPSLTWKIDPDDTVTVLAEYLRERSNGNTTPYLPAQGSLYPNPNGELKTSTFLGNPGFDHYNYDQASVALDYVHHFSDALKFISNTRYSWLSGDWNLTYGTQLEPGNPSLLDRELYSGHSNIHTIATDDHFEYEVNTGMLRHDFIAGLDFRHQVTDYRDSSGDDTPIDIFNPVYGNFVNSLAEYDNNAETLNQLGAYGQDQIAWANWRLLLGIRHDWVSDNIKQFLDDTSSDQASQATTYRAGLVYLFDNGVAPYVSYSTSFQPVTGTNAEGAPYQPMQGKQEEIGVKYQPPGLNAFITASLFNLTETNVQTPDPANPADYVQTGEDRNRGLELEAKATLLPGLDVDASYAYSSTEIVKDDAGDVGNQMPLVPQNYAAVWGHYTMQNGPLAGLGLGAGWRYRSSIYGDNDNAFRMAPLSLFDLAADYNLGHLSPKLTHLSAQVNAANVGNVKYVASCLDAVDCYWGQRRTVYATLSYDW